MRLKYFILNLFLIGTAFSQAPVITRENYFKIGDQCIKEKLRGENLQTLSVPDSGENLIWDYSNLYSLKKYEIIDTIVILDPTQTPFFNQGCVEYNKSTICYVVDFDQSHNHPDRDYHYYTVDSQKVDYLGYWSDSYVAEMNCNDYSDPLMELKFPLTFNTTYQDSYKSSWWDFVLYDYVYRYGNYILSANAYGTLILPDNTYSDVLMFKTTKTIHEKSNTVDRTLTYISYTWFSKNKRGPLLVINENYDGTIILVELYKDYIYTEVENQNRNKNFDTQLYPNPVYGISQIKLPYKNDEYSISIFNAIGELIESSRVNDGNYSINRNNFPSGIYFMLIRNKNEIVGTQKFLIVK